MSHPHQLALYRFLDHDPLRPGLEPRHMTSMQDWASLYGYDMASVFHASTSRGELYGLQAPDTRVAGPEHEVISELDTLVDTGLAQLHDLRFVRSGEAVRRLGLLARFSSRAQNFGRGFLLSVTEQSRAVVAPVEVQNSVVQKIFESVLNNSVYLDLSYEDPGGKSVYYFVKPTLGQFSLDSDTTRRLAGEFTVTPRDIDTGKELSVANAAAEVRILYGASATSVRADLLKQFNNLAVRFRAASAGRSWRGTQPTSSLSAWARGPAATDTAAGNTCRSNNPRTCPVAEPWTSDIQFCSVLFCVAFKLKKTSLKNKRLFIASVSNSLL